MPFRGVVVGQLENGERFIANVGEDPAVFRRMMEEEVMGKTGIVTHTGEVEPNLFVFDP
jgi:hypothetical protein